MKRTNRNMRIIGTSVVAAAALGAATLGTAQAAQSTSAGSTAPAKSGVPASVNSAGDLASKGANAGDDSIYINGQVKAHGHDFGILVQTIDVPAANQWILTVSVNDETTGWYKNYQTAIAKNDYTWSTSGLDIKMPGLTWTGNDKHMSMQATTPWGALDLDFAAKGPAMNYAGTGQWEMLGSTQNEFALPSLQTTGTLTAEGATYRVTGESWLDRQWGQIALGSSGHWTWMNLSLSNGDKVAIWDVVGNGTQNSWATVLHPDGSYELAAVEPLADDADQAWTSPANGSTYPTRWRIEIPSLKARLTVKVTGTHAQELGSGAVETTAATSGTYEGKHVSGWNFVEMVGSFKK